MVASEQSEVSKGQKTRRKIVMSALDLFSKNGFSNTSIKMIADSCKMSQSAIFNHFKTKEKLVEAVITDISTQNSAYVAELFEESDTGYIRLQKFFVGSVTWAAENKRPAQLLLLLYYLATFDEDFKEYYLRVAKTGRQGILELLTSMENEGKVRFHCDLGLVSGSIHHFIVGACIHALCFPSDAATPQDLQKKWDQFISAYLSQI